MESRTDLRIADATISVEGILSEKNLEQIKDANGKNVIRGNLVLQTDDTNFVTLNVYVGELTNKGEPNRAYASMKTALEQYKSIAEVGREDADLVYCSKGSLQPNSYIGRDDFSVRTNVRYGASFVSRVNNKKEYNPKAQFTVEGYINTITEETDLNGDLTGRVKIGLYVPTFKGVEPLELIVEEEDGASEFLTAFEPGQTTKFFGDIVNRTIVSEKTIKMAVGGSRKEVSRQFINELRVTGGADLPYENEMAYPVDAIKKALVDRDLRLDEEKKKAIANKGGSNFGSSTSSASTTGRTLPKFSL